MSSKIEGIAREAVEAYRKKRTVAFKKHLKALSEAVAYQEEYAGIHDPYRAAAKAHLEKEGELEIDDDAIVSKGTDEGAYVQAWVWVPNSLLPKEPTGTEGQDRQNYTDTQDRESYTTK